MNDMKELSEYTDEEKIKWFDRMYNDAREQFICVERTGATNDADEHYTWEAVIELLGSDIWDAWNSLAR
jgi:hypothetical protein